jgi:hypothetical protein
MSASGSPVTASKGRRQFSLPSTLPTVALHHTDSTMASMVAGSAATPSAVKNETCSRVPKPAVTAPATARAGGVNVDNPAVADQDRTQPEGPLPIE